MYLLFIGAYSPTGQLCHYMSSSSIRLCYLCDLSIGDVRGIKQYIGDLSSFSFFCIALEQSRKWIWTQ